jgi:hypothetical protein
VGCEVCGERGALRLACGGICPDCLAAFLAAEIAKVGYSPGKPLRCPFVCSLAPHQLPYEDYRELLGESRGAQLDELLSVKYLQQAPDVQPCPNSACRNYFIREDVPCDVSCQSCGQVVSARRGALDRLLSLASDSASTAAKVLLSQPCPCCETLIIKSFGCNHMTCQVCRH